MITCPAIVPTEEEERPEASSATPKTTPASAPEQRLKGQVGLLQRPDARPAEVEGGCRGDQHGGVD